MQSEEGAQRTARCVIVGLFWSILAVEVGAIIEGISQARASLIFAGAVMLVMHVAVFAALREASRK